LTGRGPRPDLFGIADDGSLIWVEVKVPSSASSISKEFARPVAERATALLNFINTEKRADVFLAAVASAFAGVGGGMSVNNRISSAFSMAPNFVLPKLKGEDTQVWFALVLVDGRGDSYKYAVYLTKATLRDLRNEEWVYNLYSNAEKDFKGTVVDSGDDVSALWRSYVDSVLSAVGKQSGVSCGAGSRWRRPLFLSCRGWALYVGYAYLNVVGGELPPACIDKVFNAEASSVGMAGSNDRGEEGSVSPVFLRAVRIAAGRSSCGTPSSALLWQVT
jgi:hypothetical protein